jgi:hypothetical protein
VRVANCPRARWSRSTALLPLYALQPEPDTILISRFFGAALVQLGATLYFVRDVREPATRRGLVLASVVGSLTGLAVALLGQLTGLKAMLFVTGTCSSGSSAGAAWLRSTWRAISGTIASTVAWPSGWASARTRSRASEAACSPTTFTSLGCLKATLPILSCRGCTG